ncbi:acyl-CoA dehydrogenase family protein [Rhodococcus erythropolis]
MKLSETAEDLRAVVRDFVDARASLEQVNQWDRDAHYPEDFYRSLAEIGVTGIGYPEEIGGQGGGVVEMIVVAEELARRGPDFAAGYYTSVYLGLNLLVHGTEEQKEKYLAAMIRGEKRFSLATTEPEAGSDARSIRTTARRVEGGWKLDGQKVFITGAGQPNTLMQVTARTEDENGESLGMSVFLIPNTAAGLTIRRLDTVGRHLLGTNELFFDGVFVEDHDILGEIGSGWSVLESGLVYERLTTCAGFVGSMRTMLDLVVDHVNSRNQFGQPIAAFQAVSHPIADMYCDLETSRLLTYDAAVAADTGEAALKTVTAAKLFASEAAVRSSNTAMQLFGGYAYVKEYPIERFWRELRLATISAGTSQIMRSLLAKEMGLARAKRHR